MCLGDVIKKIILVKERKQRNFVREFTKKCIC